MKALTKKQIEVDKYSVKLDDEKLKTLTRTLEETHEAKLSKMFIYASFSRSLVVDVIFGNATFEDKYEEDEFLYFCFIEESGVTKDNHPSPCVLFTSVYDTARVRFIKEIVKGSF